MCISVPRKVLKVNGDKVTIDNFQETKDVRSTISVKEGDYVLIHNDLIIEKVTKLQVENFVNTFS